MTGSDQPAPVRGACFFGGQRLLPLVEAFTKEIAGARKAEDIEHIHRMRVASRRLRAALPLFRDCYPEKNFRFWTTEIRKITRALGAARDADVQIAFLKEYLQKQQEPILSHPEIMPVPTKPDHLSVKLVLSHLQIKRNNLQKDIFHALDELEQRHVMDDIQIACQTVLPKHGRRHLRARMHGLPAVASARIGKDLLRLFSYEPWVHNPDAIAEHHAMRISAKKLRYTMEIYSPLYRWKLRKSLARIKKMQELLGDIHDCDVWIDHITLLVMKERNRPHTLHNRHLGKTYGIAPLRHLLINREKRRQWLYRQFVRFWESLQRSGFWNELQITVIAGHKNAFCIHSDVPEFSERQAIQRIAIRVPLLAEHCRSVTGLALRLFDELQDLHQLGVRDRVLLEYAALLHDIGWTSEERGHQRRSAGMILAEEDLPLNVRERGILGLIIRSHGSKVKYMADGFFHLLLNDDQQRVMALAALLRIADGLDYLHQQTVTDLQCTFGTHEVFCNIVAKGDVTIEKRRALTRGDLFTEVFGRDLVIQ
jgi:CHAD domain-containing protein